jgi:hypothetical protein
MDSLQCIEAIFPFPIYAMYTKVFWPFHSFILPYDSMREVRRCCISYLRLPTEALCTSLQSLLSLLQLYIPSHHLSGCVAIEPLKSTSIKAAFMDCPMEG